MKLRHGSRLSCLLAALLLSSCLSFISATEIVLDLKESSLGFVGESLLHNFHGEAKQFTGTAVIDPTSTPFLQHATIDIKTADLTTFNTERDQKMFSWLKVETHPAASFQLLSVKPIDGNALKSDADHPARYQVNGVFHLNETGTNQSGEPISGEALAWTDTAGKLTVSGKIDVDTLKHDLPQIREGILTVGTRVHVHYHLVFVLPSGVLAQ